MVDMAPLCLQRTFRVCGEAVPSFLRRQELTPFLPPWGRCRRQRGPGCEVPAFTGTTEEASPLVAGAGRWYAVKAMVETATLIVYTRPECSYSDALMHDLDKDGVEFQQIDLDEHPEYVAEVERLTGGERITPVMVEGGLVIVGYNGIG